MPRSTMKRLTLALSICLGTVVALPLLGCGESTKIDPNAPSSKVDPSKKPPDTVKDKKGVTRDAAPKRRLTQDNG